MLARSFLRIVIKVAGNQDRHKSSVEFHFGLNQTTHFGVTCSWVMKISHFWTWISLKPVGQPWSNFMCSIIGVGERLHKILGQIDHGTLDSGERSLPFGLFVYLPMTDSLYSKLLTELWVEVRPIWLVALLFGLFSSNRATKVRKALSFHKKPVILTVKQ